jgi:NAD+ kinase
MMSAIAENGPQAPLKTIAILYREQSDGAISLAATLAERLRASQRTVWSAPLAKREFATDSRLTGTDVALVLGGDGSILSAARMCAPQQIPILGVNFGRVGFLTELEPAEVEEKLPLYLGGDYWVDERTMLQAEIGEGHAQQHLLALNDVVVARGAEPRLIHIKVWLDGHLYNTTVADGIIVSTATGSTAYNLAAGGPILHPQVRSSVLTPIAPHLAADRSLILEPGATVTLELEPEPDGAILSADGQINRELQTGARVSISSNSHLTRFLRRRPPTHFYRILTAKLRDTI